MRASGENTGRQGGHSKGSAGVRACEQACVRASGFGSQSCGALGRRGSCVGCGWSGRAGRRGGAPCLGSSTGVPAGSGSQGPVSKSVRCARKLVGQQGATGTGGGGGGGGALTRGMGGVGGGFCLGWGVGGGAGRCRVQTGWRRRHGAQPSQGGRLMPWGAGWGGAMACVRRTAGVLGGHVFRGRRRAGSRGATLLGGATRGPPAAFPSAAQAQHAGCARRRGAGGRWDGSPPGRAWAVGAVAAGRRGAAPAARRRPERQRRQHEVRHERAAGSNMRGVGGLKVAVGLQRGWVGRRLGYRAAFKRGTKLLPCGKAKRWRRGGGGGTERPGLLAARALTLPGTI